MAFHAGEFLPGLGTLVLAPVTLARFTVGAVGAVLRLASPETVVQVGSIVGLGSFGFVGDVVVTIAALALAPRSKLYQMAIVGVCLLWTATWYVRAGWLYYVLMFLVVTVANHAVEMDANEWRQRCARRAVYVVAVAIYNCGLLSLSLN